MDNLSERIYTEVIDLGHLGKIKCHTLRNGNKVLDEIDVDAVSNRMFPVKKESPCSLLIKN